MVDFEAIACDRADQQRNYRDDNGISVNASLSMIFFDIIRLSAIINLCLPVIWTSKWLVPEICPHDSLFSQTDWLFLICRRGVCPNNIITVLAVCFNPFVVENFTNIVVKCVKIVITAPIVNHVKYFFDRTAIIQVFNNESALFIEHALALMMFRHFTSPLTIQGFWGLILLVYRIGISLRISVALSDKILLTIHPLRHMGIFLLSYTAACHFSKTQ